MSFFATAWQVGIREKCPGLLSVERPFTAIPNSAFYWAADPFPFEYEGETYIFAELYSYLHGKGTIGYCKRRPDGTFTKWKQIIKEKWHLSFPNICLLDNEFYIIPESYQSNELYVYRAVEFPNKWERVTVLHSGLVCADTVFIKNDEKLYGITLKKESGENSMQLFSVKDGKAVNFQVISKDMSFCRNAGKVIDIDGKRYRVFQDCQNGYGKRIGFSQILSIKEDIYEEQIVRYVSVDDVCIMRSRSSIIQGIHTYNTSEHYECIDWKFDDHALLGILLHGLKEIYRRLRKLTASYRSVASK